MLHPCTQFLMKLLLVNIEMQIIIGIFIQKTAVSVFNVFSARTGQKSESTRRKIKKKKTILNYNISENEICEYLVTLLWNHFNVYLQQVLNIF